MNIIVLGKGFLGKAFERAGFEVWGKEFSVERDLEKLMAFDVVINCMAKSNTRWCEDHFKEALYSNAIIPKVLSQFCDEHGKKFVHISTGCLYDRNDIANKETDFIVAHCSYVVSKWAGEKFCRERDLILRPRLFFGGRPDRNNLLCKLQKFDRYIDEANSFTSVEVVVEATKALLDAEQHGIFNVACEGYATVHELAAWISFLKPSITKEEIWESQGLYLVNNTMDLSKLRAFYHPPLLVNEVAKRYGQFPQGQDWEFPHKNIS